ncbi:hypothetical protein EMWEY_00008440, partial [Eimeria maxima]
PPSPAATQEAPYNLSRRNPSQDRGGGGEAESASWAYTLFVEALCNAGALKRAIDEAALGDYNSGCRWRKVERIQRIKAARRLAYTGYDPEHEIVWKRRAAMVSDYRKAVNAEIRKYEKMIKLLYSATE